VPSGLWDELPVSPVPFIACANNIVIRNARLVPSCDGKLLALDSFFELDLLKK